MGHKIPLDRPGAGEKSQFELVVMDDDGRLRGQTAPAGDCVMEDGVVEDLELLDGRINGHEDLKREEIEWADVPAVEDPYGSRTWSVVGSA